MLRGQLQAIGTQSAAICADQSNVIAIGVGLSEGYEQAASAGDSQEVTFRPTVSDAQITAPAPTLEIRGTPAATTLDRISAETSSRVMRYEARSHRGPLPSAAELDAYNHVVPGLAREIIDDARKEQSHRHRMEARVGTHEFILNLAGLAAMLLALIMMLAIVTYMVTIGQAVAGAGFGTAIIVGVIVALSNYRKTATTNLPTPSEQ